MWKDEVKIKRQKDKAKLKKTKHNAEHDKWLKTGAINAYHNFFHNFICMSIDVPIFFDFNCINNIHNIRNGNTGLRNICGHYYLTDTRGINLKIKNENK